MTKQNVRGWCRFFETSYSRKQLWNQCLKGVWIAEQRSFTSFVQLDSDLVWWEFWMKRKLPHRPTWHTWNSTKVVTATVVGLANRGNKPCRRSSVQPGHPTSASLQHRSRFRSYMYTMHTPYGQTSVYHVVLISCIKLGPCWADKLIQSAQKIKDYPFFVAGSASFSRQYIGLFLTKDLKVGRHQMVDSGNILLLHLSHARKLTNLWHLTLASPQTATKTGKLNGCNENSVATPYEIFYAATVQVQALIFGTCLV